MLWRGRFGRGGSGGAGAGRGFGRGSGLGRGLGRGFGLGTGVGRGRMGGARAGSGPGGDCVCTSCGAVVPHQVGIPCYGVSCPQCGAAMTKGG